MMAPPARRGVSAALRETVSDLAPFPGRMATAWRVAAVCAIVAGIAMMFNIPESAISCYLVIFLMKADGAENMVVAIAATLAITLLIALMIPIIQWTVESASLRIVIMIAVSFAFIFLGAASKLGEGGSIVALIIAFILTLVNEVPVNGVISIALRYAWEMAILPMLVIAIFSLYFGEWSVTLLRQELRGRLVLARQTLLNGPTPLVADKLAAGNDAEDKRAMLVKILHQTSQQNAAQIRADIPASYQLLFAVSALPQAASVESRQSIAGQIGAMVDALDRGEPLPPPQLAENDLPCGPLKAMRQALNTLAGQQEPSYKKGAGERFFAADAFTNPAYQRFALKTTLAAILCYMFYAAINWQGIHTAMVTCYVASLGTAGDTLHKLALRIAGCLIGAVIGVASIIFLMPQMESVGGLMLLVFFVALLAAWVAGGSEKLSYAGVQIGLAFTLTVLQGFGPTTDMDTARDRILGVLVGNLAVYLVSTLIWPAPVVTVIRQHLAQAARKIAQIAACPAATRMEMITTAAEVEQLLGEVRYCFYLLPFEPLRLRPSEAMEKTFESLSDQLASLNKDVYFCEGEADDSARRLEALALGIEQAAFNEIGLFNTSQAAEGLTRDPGGNQIGTRLERLEALVAGERA
ncbi:FUSC family protein [Brucella pseudogrignonensis]|uniref:FUSC family protein n=1 Tax=Brucella pseudogrignonensis TaxID=419475 RepID=UPI0009FF8FC9|nr:FUSC family protein [Brucella pseudogrignonensis]